MEKTETVKKEHLLYLDELRESGITNMFEATPYIQEEFPELNKKEATEVLKYWMKTFSERQK